MAVPAILPRLTRLGHDQRVRDQDEEAIQLIPQTLFEIKIAVSEIHRALFGEDDEEEETEEDS